jgi:hypothetical protein
VAGAQRDSFITMCVACGLVPAPAMGSIGCHTEPSRYCLATAAELQDNTRLSTEAGVAQLVEQRIRNAWVGSSNLFTGTNPINNLRVV